jgi:hypothetical protein
MRRDDAIGEYDYADERDAQRRGAWPAVRRVAGTIAELIRARGRVRHVPTLQQVRAMAELDGWEPCSYRLDRTVNWLPPIEEMPVGLERELGRHALSFSCRLPTGHDAELVVFPSGHGFDLLGGF